MAEGTCDIGLIGLAVMGQNLVLNMNDHGYKVAVFNRTTSKVDEFLADEAKGTKVVGTHSAKDLCAALKLPRRVMLMVKAGEVVDQTIEHVLPYLEKGDILIDGGNSLFTDTNRRTKALAEKGILFVGTGVSGGEEGARFGPSIMPGGNPAAWPHVKEIFQAIAAKVEGGVPCCDWVGEDGAGHYVKMVHNGVEYGLMEAYAEGFEIMHASDYELDMEKIAHLWNQGSVVRSWLLELLDRAFRQEGSDLAEIKGWVEDSGEGRWTVFESIDKSVPAPAITLALMQRFASRQDESYAAKVNAALRNQFGGHAVQHAK
jgi:6-phosphogluconate dehydrogenase